MGPGVGAARELTDAITSVLKEIEATLRGLGFRVGAIFVKSVRFAGRSSNSSLSSTPTQFRAAWGRIPEVYPVEI